MKVQLSVGKNALILFAVLTIQCKARVDTPPIEHAVNEGVDNNFEKIDPEERRYIKAKGGLRLRAEPSSKSKTLGIIPECAHVFQTLRTKDTVTIDAMTGAWVKLRYSGPKKNIVEGWGFEPYLSIPIPEVPVTQNDITTFKSGCLNITGEGSCMGCGSINFWPNRTFRIAYDCHSIGDGTWYIKDGKILVDANQYIGGCGHFAEPEKCEKAPKGPPVRYEFKLTAGNTWLIKTDSKQWEAKDFLHWSKEWNNVGKMYCLDED